MQLALNKTLDHYQTSRYQTNPFRNSGGKSFELLECKMLTKFDTNTMVIKIVLHKTYPIIISKYSLIKSIEVIMDLQYWYKESVCKQSCAAIYL